MWAKVNDCINRKAHQNDEENTEFIYLAFIDLCIYFAFLTVTTVFTMSTRDVSMHHFGQIIERLFVSRPTYNEQGFELTFSDLVTVDDWWSFVETTFLESIAQFGSQNEQNRLAIEGHVLVGLPRLRQIRVHNETCTIHDAFRNQFRTCYGKYSKDNEDVSGFVKNMWAKVNDCINRKAHQNDEENTEFIYLAFIDLCIYFTFLTVTTVFTMSTRDVSMHHFGQVIERLFVSRPTYNEQGFELTFSDLVTVDDWWSFVETTFLESIAQFGSQNEQNRLAIEGHVLVGLPRLRQIRVHNETCTIHGAFRNQFRTCYGKYSKDNEDVSGFVNKTHLTISEIITNNIWGRITTYYGGGYIEALSLQQDKNMEVLHNLKNSSWIDRGTRVILIEFALFNADVNLFCNVKLLAEIPPSGGILTSTAIQPLKYSALCRGYFECTCAVMFYVLILYYTLEMVLTIIVIGFNSFCCSMWNILDFAVIMFGYYSLFYIIWHTIYLYILLDNAALGNLSLDVICYWNMVFVAAMGICVFIVWIKLFKYIKLNKTILQFSTTLGKCAKDLLGFAIMFAIVFIAYADLSLLLFGTVHANFCDFPTAVLTMFRMVLGDFNYEEMEEANAYLAPIFFLSYILFVFFILLNMFLAIINDTYSKVKGEITEGKGNNFEQYIKALLEKLRNYILPNKQGKNSVNDLEESSPEEINLKELKGSSKHFLDSWFEIISFPRTPEEQDALIQRIAMLEKSLEKLVESLDKILKKIETKT